MTGLVVLPDATEPVVTRTEVRTQWVQVDSEPQGATVRLDDAVLGATPTKVPLTYAVQDWQERRKHWWAFLPLALLDVVAGGTVMWLSYQRDPTGRDVLGQAGMIWGASNAILGGWFGISAATKGSRRQEEFGVAAIEDHALRVTADGWTQARSLRASTDGDHAPIHVSFKELEAVDWQRAETASTPESYSEYLAKYPMSVRLDEARRRVEAAREQRLDAANAVRDDSVWNGAREQDTEASYRNYLDELPKGKWRSKAMGRVEELVWRRVEGQDDRQGYLEYLSKCSPNCRADARRRLARLERKEPDPPHRRTADRICLTIKTATAGWKMASALPLANPEAELDYQALINPDYRTPVPPGFEDSLRDLLKTHINFSARCPSDPKATQVVVTLGRTLVHSKGIAISGPSAGSPMLMLFSIEPKVRIDVKTSLAKEPVAFRVFPLRSVDMSSAYTRTTSARSLVAFSTTPGGATGYYDVDWKGVLEAEGSSVSLLADRIISLLTEVASRGSDSSTPSKSE